MKTYTYSQARNRLAERYRHWLDGVRDIGTVDASKRSSQLKENERCFLKKNRAGGTGP